MEEVSTVGSNVIREPFIQVEVFATGGKSSNVQGEGERSDF